MARDSKPTGYARLTPVQARAVMAVFVLGCGFLMAVSLSPLANRDLSRKKTGEGDAALYRAKIERIRAGESYYHAAGAEMRARGYPTRSVFNWRLPTPFWVIGWMPSVVLGRAVLGGLGLALMLMAFEALAREEGNRLRRPVACVLLLTGPLLLCVLYGLYVMPVVWAGVFIGLSMCAYGVNRPRLGVATGLAAVFFRELALPYCVVAAALAWHYKRHSELLAWIVGLAAWLAFFGWHCVRVAELITPNDLAHSEGWVQLGGAAFVIATAQMNAYLLLLPQWAAALYLAAAVFGFAGWHTRLGLRCGLSVCLFVTAFSVVGQEFNQYWGSLVGPLLCFGVARLPASLGDLWKAAALGLGFRLSCLRRARRP